MKSYIYLLNLLLSICSTCHFLRPCMVVCMGPCPLVVIIGCLVLVPMLMGVSMVLPGVMEIGVSPVLPVLPVDPGPGVTGVDPGVMSLHLSSNLYAPGLKHQISLPESFSFS